MEDKKVTLETAFSAKECGYPQDVKASNTASIPSQSILQKWLREEEGIFVEVHYMLEYNCYRTVLKFKEGSKSEGIEVCSLVYSYEEALEKGLYEALQYCPSTQKFEDNIKIVLSKDFEEDSKGVIHKLAKDSYDELLECYDTPLINYTLLENPTIEQLIEAYNRGYVLQGNTVEEFGGYGFTMLSKYEQGILSVKCDDITKFNFDNYKWSITGFPVSKEDFEPFTWEDREQLRGEWVTDGENEFFINTFTKGNGKYNNLLVYFNEGWRNGKQLLESYTFLTGSYCGKIKY